MQYPQYHWFRMDAHVFLSICLTVVAGFSLSWLFGPTIHYFQSVNVNTMSSADYTMKDRTNGQRSVGISVVVPAYNEELRIPIMLDSTLKYLDRWSSEHMRTYEIIVVDDGSTDDTAAVVQSYMKQRPHQLHLLRLHANRGKGAALKMGVRESIGDIVLIADADAATDINDLDRLLPALFETAGMKKDSSDTFEVADRLAFVAGSRAHMAKESVATRAFYRTVLMKGFHFYVQLMVTAHVQDTQCGFKLFTRRAAKTLFSSLHLYRWAFDTELIYVAERLHIPIVEVAVNWHEVDGSKLITSKLDVVTTSITMARDILCMRLSYLLGLWEAPVLAAAQGKTVTSTKGSSAAAASGDL